jgi:hypothetical protein
MSEIRMTITLDIDKDGKYHIWGQKKEHLLTREQKKFELIKEKLKKIMEEVQVRQLEIG